MNDHGRELLKEAEERLGGYMGENQKQVAELRQAIREYLGADETPSTQCFCHCQMCQSCENQHYG